MNYDLTIIGAGWAGFNAALKAKELGLKACLIEKSQLGGICLNLGCIPTKTLIQSGKVFSLAKKSSVFGIEANNPQINFSHIQDRKNKIIQQLQSGMQSMLRGIDIIYAEAKIISPTQIQAGDKQIKTKFILIATGSTPLELGILKFNGNKILSSNEILNLSSLPQSLLIVGGGVIGCEFTSLFSALGSKVTIVEKMPQLLPGEDQEVARKIEGIFKKKGIKVNTDSDAANFNTNDYDIALVCVGRGYDIEGLGLEEAGVKTEKGKIIADEYLRTNIGNIYAAGDCTGKIMLAHFAAYQGKVAAENLANPKRAQKADNTSVPNCIFTDPEIASVGIKEEEALKIGTKVKRFDFLASGMARILDETDGFIKIFCEKDTQEILGAAIIGPKATELIGILTLMVSCRLKFSDLEKTIFAHPTLSEVLHEVK